MKKFLLRGLMCLAAFVMTLVSVAQNRGPFDRLCTPQLGLDGVSMTREPKRPPMSAEQRQAYLNNRQKQMTEVPPGCTDMIVDGGFETGGIPNTFWNPETSTNFGTPVCDVPNCGTGGGASPPRTGAIWAWFGGIPAPETATLGQTMIIPVGTASLDFYMRVGTVSSPFTDVLNVRVDGAIVQSYPEPAVAEGAYTFRTINLNAFADGLAHAILFEYIGPSSGTGSYVVDDVELASCPLACTLTCPANITVGNDLNQCGAVVNYPAPTTSGSCGIVTGSPASGSFFPIGTTTVNVTSSIGGGTCSFTITVNDTQPPTITCPANVTVSNDPNQCGAVVNYPAPTVSDNCPGVTFVSSPASGSFFPIGTTTVTATATDAAGLTATCTFTVTVNDTQAPTITCPANITLCGGSQVVSFPAPTVTDNCPGAGAPVSVPASGSIFPVGTTTVTSTVTDAAGNPASCTFNVIINPTPFGAATPTSQTICSANAITTIVLSSSEAGTTFNWTRNNTVAVTGIAASGSGNISGVLTNTTNAPVLVTFTIIPTAAGCAGPSFIADVLVNPTPNAVATPATQTICSPGTITTIVLSGAVSGTTFNWTRDNTVNVTGIAASGSGNISGTLTNITAVQQTVTFTITPTANGCPGAAVTATVIVNPQPIVSPVPANQVVCNGVLTAPVNFTGPVASTVFSWTNNNTTIGLAASGTGNIPAFNAINTGTVPVIATVTVTPSTTGAGVCTPSAPQTFTNSTPLAIPTGPAVVTSTLVVAGAPVYLYDLNMITNITHTFAGDLDITIRSPAGTVVTLTTDNGGGNDNVFNGTLWNDNANPGGQVPYTTNNGVTTDHLYANLALASPLAPEEPLGAFIGENPNGTWTITISDDAGGDGGFLNLWSLVVSGLTAAPVLTSTSATNSTPVAIPAGPAVVSSNLVVSGAGTVLHDVNLTTFITHTFASDLDITLRSPAGTIVTLTTDNGGGNDNVYNGTVWDDDANPAGQVPYTTNNGLATDHAYVNLTLASPLAPEEPMAAFIGENPNGTWTITISDDAGGDAGSLASWTLNLQTAVCNATIPCTGPPVTYTYTVNPTPNAVATPASQTVCSANPITTIVLTGAVSGTTFNWTRNNTVTVTGIAASGSGNISGALTNTTAAPITVTFTITPTANGCAGTPITATVLVNPTPNAVATPASQTVCSDYTVSIFFTGAVSGTTFNWTRDNTVTVTGIAASGSGNISGTLTNNTTAPVTVTFTITPTANGCPGTPITATVLVNPKLTVNAVANQVLCNGSNTAAVIFSSPVPGPVVFSWSNTNTSIGLVASGTGNIPSFVAINTGAIPVFALITVFPTLTISGITCTGTPITFIITVNPTPTVNVVANQTVCNGSVQPVVPFSGAVIGTLFSWTNNTTSIGLAASGTGNLPAFTAINPTQVPVIATITVTPSYTNGGPTCTGTPRTFTITVNPTPIVVATDLFNLRVCLSDTLIPLVGTPAGGVWTGIGVSGFNFVPSVTAVGTYVLTYTFTNSLGCTSRDTTTVKVVDCPERLRLLTDPGAVEIFPNPSNGQFNVRLKSTLYNYLGIKTYNMLGQLMVGKAVTNPATDRETLVTPTYTGLVYGRTIPVDLSHLANGTYLIVVYYDDGIRTSKKGFLIVIQH